MKSAFLIAATSSGSGKTTLSLGLMRALTRRGLRVQPFKCGPDYIDTQFHRIAGGGAITESAMGSHGLFTGVESINLDTFMSSEEHVKGLFKKYSAEADVSIAEGVMGMFDGYSKMKGSSADIGRLLDIPVVLLINAASTAYSVAATIFGFKNFCPDVRIAGVIFNRVGSESHFSFLKDACDDAGIECFGYISKMAGLETPSRHLGLTLTAVGEMDRFIETAADAVGAHIDIDRLLAATRRQPDTTGQEEEKHYATDNRPEIRISVARDEAFSFIYPENLRALESNQAWRGKITFFSPIHDRELPTGTDLLYIPGGYPELFAAELEANTRMRSEIREFIENGGMAFGECGGLIYLGQDIDGREMCGALPVRSTMDGARLSLGYRKVNFGDFEMRGHEFHYSRSVNPEILPSVASQTNIRGGEVPTPVYRYKNLIAGYTHLYWADNDISKLWKPNLL